MDWGDGESSVVGDRVVSEYENCLMIIPNMGYVSDKIMQLPSWRLACSKIIPNMG